MSRDGQAPSYSRKKDPTSARSKPSMLVVLTSRFDRIGVELAKSWADHGALLMTCEDLSRHGWKDHLKTSGSVNGRAVIAGQPVDFANIDGVLVRLPHVSEEELNHIVVADRGYVAAEMTAYLASWLSRLACPVLNRPTPTCLAGPPWPEEKWLRVAAQLGVRTRPAKRDSRSATPTSGCPARSRHTVTVVGNQAYGDAGRDQLRGAVSLALAAGVELLAAEFVESVLMSVNLWPTLESQEVRDAILHHLLTSKRAGGR